MTLVTQRHQPSLIYQYITQEHHDMNWYNVSILNKHQNTYSEISWGRPHIRQLPQFEQIHHIANVHNNYTQVTQHSKKIWP